MKEVAKEEKCLSIISILLYYTFSSHILKANLGTMPLNRKEDSARTRNNEAYIQGYICLERCSGLQGASQKILNLEAETEAPITLIRVRFEIVRSKQTTLTLAASGTCSQVSPTLRAGFYGHHENPVPFFFLFFQFFLPVPFLNTFYEITNTEQTLVTTWHYPLLFYRCQFFGSINYLPLKLSLYPEEKLVHKPNNA